jgi:hypothetical protein
VSCGSTSPKLFFGPADDFLLDRANLLAIEVQQHIFSASRAGSSGSCAAGAGISSTGLSFPVCRFRPQLVPPTRQP